ncbi:hypothetical protein OZ411_36035 [Bradyrhizobium sp. Arg237L]|uniref:hypothetical protein n=1 Tax=Bradyrhizobium sp. Arg237L TaxID=3003352 RepID=UPI00249DDCB8|nr:hypothetical protein [Bradyrhizobium sp. Arg237L]MDI4238225.1 hypothetical protein [Bradyrhizobium sp. Arg237L]
MEVLESAIGEVERFSAERSQEVVPPASPTSPGTAKPQLPQRPTAAPSPFNQSKRSGVFGTAIRLAAVFLVLAIAGAAVFYWPSARSSIAALLHRPPPAPAQSAPPAPRETAPIERPQAAAEAPAAPPAPAAEHRFPLPSTFGVFVLSDGQLQELKVLPGKVPDRRVAISAAIPTPPQTSVPGGDVKFITFRPELGPDSAGPVEVRVVAKVSRTMGVDSTGTAKMTPGGDSWVIRSASFPFKIGPVEDQPKMLLIQPENDGLVLSPGRYVLVVKGIGYDFSVSGQVTDPNQCVERFNAANGAFYSPCPTREQKPSKR